MNFLKAVITWAIVWFVLYIVIGIFIFIIDENAEPGIAGFLAFILAFPLTKRILRKGVKAKENHQEEIHSQAKDYKNSNITQEDSSKIHQEQPDGIKEEPRYKKVILTSSEGLSNKMSYRLPESLKQDEENVFEECFGEVDEFVRQILEKRKRLIDFVKCNDYVIGIKNISASSQLHILGYPTKELTKISFKAIAYFKVFSNGEKLLIAIRGLKGSGVTSKTYFYLFSPPNEVNLVCSTDALDFENIKRLKLNSELKLEVTLTTPDGKNHLITIVCKKRGKLDVKLPPDLKLNKDLVATYILTRAESPFYQSIGLSEFLSSNAEKLTKEDWEFVMSMYEQIPRYYIYMASVLITYVQPYEDLFKKVKDFINNYNPDSEKELAWKGEALKALGDIYLKKGDKELALKYYKQALDLNPKLRIKRLVKRLEKELNQSHK